MAMTKRLGAYADVHATFTAALEHDGGTLTFPTPGAARNWRQRAYYYRQLLGTNYPHFDRIHMRHEDCRVELTLTKLNAEFTTPEGEAVTIQLEEVDHQSDSPAHDEDPLLIDAMNLLRTTQK